MFDLLKYLKKFLFFALFWSAYYNLASFKILATQADRAKYLNTKPIQACAVLYVCKLAKSWYQDWYIDLTKDLENKLTLKSYIKPLDRVPQLAIKSISDPINTYHYTDYLVLKQRLERERAARKASEERAIVQAQLLNQPNWLTRLKNYFF